MKKDGKDMVTFILTVAATVLGNVITELIMGNTTLAGHQDIQIRISEELRTYESGGSELVPQIASEVMVLAEKDARLSVSSKGLSLKESPQDAQAALRSYLEELEEIVESRRKELGLPTELEGVSTVVEEDSGVYSASVRWIAAAEPVSETAWRDEQREILDVIRRRRAGEETGNEA